jgi:DNA-binding NtrC family response regulator
MVENAGGSIEVKSREGEGTSFLMKFEGKKRQEDMYRANMGAGQVRTVCVCRDQKNLAPWKAWLDSLGTRIEYRSHEAAVISRLQEKKHFCDILITENELETMSGIDLAQIVKRTDSGIQVILLTREMTDGQKWYMDNGILDQIRLPDSEKPL